MADLGFKQFLKEAARSAFISFIPLEGSELCKPGSMEVNTYCPAV